MRNLFRFILKFHRTILFLFLELICFFLIINNNQYQRAVVFNSSNKICGQIYESFDNISSFVQLKEYNKRLIAENTKLKNILECNDVKEKCIDTNYTDSVQKYVYRYAKVVNISTNKKQNSITVNKGSCDGVKEEMAVISDEGVVGIVRSVSRHYSTILPIINEESSISAKIKKNMYFGSLSWNGRDYRKAVLKEIPFHVKISEGDTVITSGYSSIFPEGICIATIDKYKHSKGDNFLDITVNLTVDFKKLNYVYIIENRDKEEQLNIENNCTND